MHRSITARRHRMPRPRRPHWWASMLVAGLLVTAAAGACGTEPEPAGPSGTPGAGVSESPGAAISKVRLMKERVLLLQGYIETYAGRHYHLFPGPDDVRRGGVLDAPLWPADPWTGEAMTPGVATGCYTYTVADDRRSYRLVGHLPDSVFEVKGSMPRSALTAYAHRGQEGLSLIRQYVIEWARRNGDLYPPASEVDRGAGVGALPSRGFWPSNPWNHDPMRQSDAVGDFSYEVAADGSSCLLSLHVTESDDWTLDCDAQDL